MGINFPEEQVTDATTLVYFLLMQPSWEPGSTKNAKKLRNRKMHQTKKATNGGSAWMWAV